MVGPAADADEAPSTAARNRYCFRRSHRGSPLTLYLHTSSLLKVFVEEPHSEAVSDLVTNAAAVFTSDVAYPEVRAALARRRREGTLSSDEFNEVKRTLDSKWPDLLTISASHALCRDAGELAERYQLRGFDSIHLASFAEMLRGVQGRDDVEFSSFDDRLNAAARKLARKLR